MRLDNLPVAQIAKFAYDDQPDKTIQVASPCHCWVTTMPCVLYSPLCPLFSTMPCVLPHAKTLPYSPFSVFSPKGDYDRLRESRPQLAFLMSCVRPLLTLVRMLRCLIQVYNLGFPIGAKLHEEVHTDDAVAEHYVLNNHLRFKILYHPAADEMDDLPGEWGHAVHFALAKQVFVRQT